VCEKGGGAFGGCVCSVPQGRYSLWSASVFGEAILGRRCVGDDGSGGVDVDVDVDVDDEPAAAPTDPGPSPGSSSEEDVVTLSPAPSPSRTTTPDTDDDSSPSRQCISWVRFGACPRGLDCPFRHPSTAERPCPAFLRGHCPVVAAKCPFSHAASWHTQPPSPHDCLLCGKFYSQPQQRDDHLAGRGHKYWEQVRDLNNAVALRKIASPRIGARCFNCWQLGHRFCDCPTLFCRHHANGRGCRFGRKCDLIHVASARD
jgi:hypothetical protein